MTTTAALPTLDPTHRCPACRRPTKLVVTPNGSHTFVDLEPRPNGAMVPVSPSRFIYLLPLERAGRNGYSLHHRSGACRPYDDEE